MPKISNKKIRRIELFAALKNMRSVLESAPKGDDLNHDEFDQLSAHLKTLSWRKGSRAEQLTSLLEQIIDSYSQSNGSASFHATSVLTLVGVLEKRFNKDVDLSKPKRAKKDSK